MRDSHARSDHSAFVLPPPLIYLLSFLFALWLQRLMPLPRFVGTVPRALAIGLAVATLALGFSSLRRFRTAKTTFTHLRPTRTLVTGGPYRWTRNPMYVGLSLFYLAAACWYGQLWAVGVVLLPLWIMNTWIIPAEERYLRSKFSVDYERYRAKVRRWL